MLIPARRLATLTLEQTRLVVASAWGMDWMTRRVGVADALLDECGEAAQVIDAERLGRAVEGMRDGGEVLILAARGDLRHRGDGNTLVDDGDTVLALEVLGGLDQMLSRVRHVVVDLRAHAVEVLVTATHERNTHGDGPDVEVLLLNHAAGFRDFCGRDRHPWRSYLPKRA